MCENLQNVFVSWHYLYNGLKASPKFHIQRESDNSILDMIQFIHETIHPFCKSCVCGSQVFSPNQPVTFHQWYIWSKSILEYYSNTGSIRRSCLERKTCFGWNVLPPLLQPKRMKDKSYTINPPFFPKPNGDWMMPFFESTIYFLLLYSLLGSMASTVWSSLLRNDSHWVKWQSFLKRRLFPSFP